MARLTASALILLAGAADAQEWSYGSFDNGSWFEAHVVHVGREVGLHCGGRSPGGQPLPQSDEPQVTGPYVLDIAFGHDGLGGSITTMNPTRDDIMVVSGSAGYLLQGTYFDVLNDTGWVQPLGLGDPLLVELMQSSAFSLDVAGNRLAVYGASGLAAALATAMAFCDARWAAIGEAVPEPAIAMVNQLRSSGLDIQPRAALPGAAQAPQQGFSLPPTAPPAAAAHIRGLCQGEYDINLDGVQSADFDGDGAGDYIVNWTDVTCFSPLGARPFCGAANCQIDIFMSSLGYAAAPALLGVSTQVVGLSDGRSGFTLGGSRSRSLCSAGACDRPWVWNGTQFTQ